MLTSLILDWLFRLNLIVNQELVHIVEQKYNTVIKILYIVNQNVLLYG